MQLIEVDVSLGEINISGHANYVPQRADIVCAGVTTVMQTLVKSITDLTEDEIEYEISPGRVDIKYKDLSRKIYKHSLLKA